MIEKEASKVLSLLGSSAIQDIKPRPMGQLLFDEQFLCI